MRSEQHTGPNLQKRTSNLGADMYSAVTAIAKNRLQSHPRAIESVHGRASVLHGDLLAGNYETFDTTRNYFQLCDRIENRSGISLIDHHDSFDQILKHLANRFAPTFYDAPPASQWDVLWRSAETIAAVLGPRVLMNRTAPEGISSSDWQKANSLEPDVQAKIWELTLPVDRGEAIFYTATAAEVRGVFQRKMRQLMADKPDAAFPRDPFNLNLEKAFEFIKTNEPIFWTLAMLAFDDDTPHDRAWHQSNG